MRVLRVTMWTPDLEPVSMVTREVDLEVPLDEAAEQQKILPGGFVLTDIFEVDDDADIIEATLEATRRQQKVLQREADQALLYYWDAAKFGQLAHGGVLTGTLPCPLTADEIENVLVQLASHPEYRSQTIIAISERMEVVTMKDGTARRETFTAAGNGGVKSTLKVYAVAFRHKTPGEGVGGFEWDTEPGAARKRIEEIGVFEDSDYETTEREFEFEGLTLADKDAITDRIDAALWEEWIRE